MVAAITQAQMHCHTLVSFIAMICVVQATRETGRQGGEKKSNISEDGKVRRASLMFSIKVAGM